MNKEIWKDITNYEGLYQISNLGRVRGLDRTVKTRNGRTQFKKGMVLKNKMGTTGYPYVILYKENKPESLRVHALVAQEFIGERPKGYDTCHIDGDRLNNSLSNLRYDTRSENFIDHYRTGKKNPNGKLEIKEVLEIRKLCKQGELSQRKIGELFDISESQIRNIANKKTYVWLNDDGTIKDSKTSVFKII